MRCTFATAVLAGLVFLAITLFGPGNSQGPPKQAMAQKAEPAFAQPQPVKPPELPATMPEFLLKDVDVEFINVPLLDTGHFLGEQVKVPIFFDKKALGEEGVAVDEPISLHASKTPLYLVLNRILKPLGLAWYSKDGLLFITTQTAEEEIFFTKYYEVKPLLESGYSQVSLLGLIQQMTAGHWELVDGTGGMMLFVGQTLTVRQTFRVQVEVAQLLAALQKSDQPILHLEPKEHAKLRQALSSPVAVEFIDTPLKDAAAFLGDAAGVPIALDRPALTDEGIAFDKPVNLVLKGKSLETTLDLLLRGLGLEAVLQDGTILITSKAAADEKLTTVIYHVKDIADTPSGMDQLREAIYTATEGLWMQIDGTGGEMIAFDKLGTLVVRQREPVHQGIIELLQNQRRKPAGEIKLQPLPPRIQTKMYRMNAQTAEDLLTTLPEFIAPETWQDAKMKGLGSIRRVAAGQTFVKYPDAPTPQRNSKLAQAQPNEAAAETPPAKAEPKPQYIVVPQAVLIIRQTKEVHREISKFLLNLLPGENFNGTGFGGGGFF